jgi:hypothetical protein
MVLDREKSVIDLGHSTIDCIHAHLLLRVLVALQSTMQSVKEEVLRTQYARTFGASTANRADPVASCGDAPMQAWTECRRTPSSSLPNERRNAGEILGSSDERWIGTMAWRPGVSGQLPSGGTSNSTWLVEQLWTGTREAGLGVFRQSVETLDYLQVDLFICMIVFPNRFRSHPCQSKVYQA